MSAEQIAASPGWAADDASLPETCRQTHDNVVDILGDRRRGPVTWLTFRGIHALKAIGDMQRSERNPGMLAALDQIEAFLVTKGGIFVLATAPGVET